VSDWDDLIERARENAESGGGAPPEWGERIALDIDEAIRGRHRGHEEGGKSGAYLLWDTDEEARYIWGCASLDREYDREQPAVGDDVVIARKENYRTQYDAPDDDPSGLSYGVATRKNEGPLPGHELPF
jgi:hypothetical protein